MMAEARRKVVVGIDFGDSKSTLSVSTSTFDFNVILSSDGDRAIPNAITFWGNQRFVGVQAISKGARADAVTVSRLKHQINMMPPICAGRDVDEKSKTLDTTTASIIEQKPPPAGDLSLEEMTAMILRSLKNIAMEIPKSKASSVNEEWCTQEPAFVLSIPHSWKGDAREALLNKAATLAGLKQTTLLCESEAASIAYAYGYMAIRREPEIPTHYLVIVDLGYSTFKLSLVRFSNYYHPTDSICNHYHIEYEVCKNWPSGSTIDELFSRLALDGVVATSVMFKESLLSHSSSSRSSSHTQTPHTFVIQDDNDKKQQQPTAYEEAGSWRQLREIRKAAAKLKRAFTEGVEDFRIDLDDDQEIYVTRSSFQRECKQIYGNSIASETSKLFQLLEESIARNHQEGADVAQPNATVQVNVEFIGAVSRIPDLRNCVIRHLASLQQHDERRTPVMQLNRSLFLTDDEAVAVGCSLFPHFVDVSTTTTTTLQDDKDDLDASTRRLDQWELNDSLAASRNETLHMFEVELRSSRRFLPVELLQWFSARLDTCKKKGAKGVSGGVQKSIELHQESKREIEALRIDLHQAVTDFISSQQTPPAAVLPPTGNNEVGVPSMPLNIPFPPRCTTTHQIEPQQSHTAMTVDGPLSPPTTAVQSGSDCEGKHSVDEAEVLISSRVEPEESSAESNEAPPADLLAGTTTGSEEEPLFDRTTATEPTSVETCSEVPESSEAPATPADTSTAVDEQPLFGTPGTTSIDTGSESLGGNETPATLADTSTAVEEQPLFGTPGAASMETGGESIGSNNEAPATLADTSTALEEQPLFGTPGTTSMETGSVMMPQTREVTLAVIGEDQQQASVHQVRPPAEEGDGVDDKPPTTQQENFCMCCCCHYCYVSY